MPLFQAFSLFTHIFYIINSVTFCNIFFFTFLSHCCILKAFESPPCIRHQRVSRTGREHAHTHTTWHLLWSPKASPGGGTVNDHVQKVVGGERRTGLDFCTVSQAVVTSWGLQGGQRFKQMDLSPTLRFHLESRSLSIHTSLSHNFFKNKYNILTIACMTVNASLLLDFFLITSPPCSAVQTRSHTSVISVLLQTTSSYCHLAMRMSIKNSLLSTKTLMLRLHLPPLFV